MAKNIDYIAKLSVLAGMTEEQTRQPSTQREEEAQALLDSMITTLSREWITPLDREDIALIGQCLVRLTKTIGDMTDRERLVAAEVCGYLSPLVEHLSDLHKIGQCLSTATGIYPRIVKAEYTAGAPSPAFCEYADTARECADVLIGIILKYS